MGQHGDHRECTAGRASLSWEGIRIANPGGLVTVGRSTPTAGTILTIGASGINMSTATQDIIINSPTTVLIGATQTWSVAAGRNLRLGTTGAGGATWKWTPITANSTADNLRPLVPMWKDPHTALVWVRGTYKSNRGE